jgi:hypothetical protein
MRLRTAGDLLMGRTVMLAMVSASRSRRVRLITTEGMESAGNPFAVGRKGARSVHFQDNQ